MLAPYDNVAVPQNYALILLPFEYVNLILIYSLSSQIVGIIMLCVVIVNNLYLKSYIAIWNGKMSEREQKDCRRLTRVSKVLVLEKIKIWHV